MGKTVASYRIALEWEIANWKQFRNAMSSEEQSRLLMELEKQLVALFDAGMVRLRLGGKLNE